jgi:glutamate 5-kinase
VTRRLDQARRIVVKIGSSLLTGDGGGIRQDWLQALAEDVAALRGRGQEVLLVSSGAVAVGRERLSVQRQVLKLEEKQAAAAVGQIRLAHAYQQVLDRHHITVAQVLLTLGDTEQRRRYQNARSTLNTLLRLGAVPLINENDTVATTEIRFGDNDRLAARVAEMASAEALVLLSDIDGMYTADPAIRSDAVRLDEVPAITPEIEAMAGASRSDLGSGGMITKLEAAKIALGAGCHVVIGAGAERHALAGLRAGAPCTWFVAAASPRTARKRWIAGALKPAGSLTIDDGARAALGAGKSLLPPGVIAVAGGFDRGDAVAILDRAGVEIGRGLSAYAIEDARRILGHKSREIERILGYRGRSEMIHRDDLVLHRDGEGERE